MIAFWDCGKKGVIFDEIYSFDGGVYLPNDICWRRRADKSTYRSQRVNDAKMLGTFLQNYLANIMKKYLILTLVFYNGSMTDNIIFIIIIIIITSNL